MIDAYARYCEIYLRLYGYPYPVTREEWSVWSSKGSPLRPPIDDESFDVETERREGYAYGDTL